MMRKIFEFSTLCKQLSRVQLFHSTSQTLARRSTNYRAHRQPSRPIETNRITIDTPHTAGKKRAYFNLGKEFATAEKQFALKGKAEDLAEELDMHDPQDLMNAENDEDLNLYARSKDAFHKKVIDEDVARRKRIKMAIVSKKIAKLEGRQQKSMNLLTWDAKEQIKHLNLNYPGFKFKSKFKLYSSSFFFKI